MGNGGGAAGTTTGGPGAGGGATSNGGGTFFGAGAFFATRAGGIKDFLADLSGGAGRGSSLIGGACSTGGGTGGKIGLRKNLFFTSQPAKRAIRRRLTMTRNLPRTDPEADIRISEFSSSFQPGWL